MGRTALDLGEKTCENPVCGRRFGRSRFEDGRLEDAGVFRRRRHCSQACANTRREVTKGTHHYRARKLRGPSCEACGGGRRLQAHHVDQDYTNNTAENVQTLCKWCHDFWHSLARRLGREVAGRMPSLALVRG